MRAVLVGAVALLIVGGAYQAHQMTAVGELPQIASPMMSETSGDHCAMPAQQAGSPILRIPLPAGKEPAPLFPVPPLSLQLMQDAGQDEVVPPGHSKSAGEGCSRANKNAPPDAELNGVNPKTVGCKCVRKCISGGTQEDSGDPKDKYATRCKNYCFKDRCSCPDPCKT